MAKTKLEKVEAKNKNLLAKNRKDKAEREADWKKLVVGASGVAGEGFGATAGALIDAKMAEEGEELATFGESGVPITPVIGVGLAIAGVPLAMVTPAGGNFVGRMGLWNAMNGLNHAIKNKARRDWFNQDEG